VKAISPPAAGEKRPNLEEKEALRGCDRHLGYRPGVRDATETRHLGEGEKVMSREHSRPCSFLHNDKRKIRGLKKRVVWVGTLGKGFSHGAAHLHQKGGGLIDVSLFSDLNPTKKKKKPTNTHHNKNHTKKHPKKKKKKTARETTPPNKPTPQKPHNANLSRSRVARD